MNVLNVGEERRAVNARLVGRGGWVPVRLPSLYRYGHPGWQAREARGPTSHPQGGGRGGALREVERRWREQ